MPLLPSQQIITLAVPVSSKAIYLDRPKPGSLLAIILSSREYQ